MIFLTGPEQFVPVALQQGIALSHTEAKTILGYLEGHDYVLLLDECSNTMRHDIQSEDDHTEDTSYSVKDTVQFAIDMNEDLLRDTEIAANTVDGRLDVLNEDHHILTALMDRISGGLHGQKI